MVSFSVGAKIEGADKPSARGEFSRGLMKVCWNRFDGFDLILVLPRAIQETRAGTAEGLFPTSGLHRELSEKPSSSHTIELAGEDDSEDSDAGMGDSPAHWFKDIKVSLEVKLVVASILGGARTGYN